MSTGHPITVVRARLAGVRSRAQAVACAAGASRAVVFVLAGLAAVMVLDFILELPVVLRAVSLAAIVGVVTAVLWSRVIAVLRAPPDDDDIALRVERHQPALRQRLISAVQLARDPALAGSPALVSHLARETEQLLAPLDLSAVVSLRPLARWAGGAAGTILLFTLLLLSWGADARALLLRALCVPGIDVPRMTRVELVTPSPLVIARGEEVTLVARARGVVPASGELRVESSTSPQRYPMPRRSPATQRSDEFAVTLRGVGESFAYRVHLNDGRSAPGQVRVSVRPLATKPEAVVLPPAYTRQPPARRAIGDLTLLQGSRLQLTVEASKPVRAASEPTSDLAGHSRVVLLSPRGITRAYPLARDPADPRKLRALDADQTSIPLPDDTTGLAFILVDDDGLETRDPTVYRVDLRPDRAPSLRVIEPARKEEVVTRNAQLRVAFEVSDDIALASLELRYLIKLPAAGEVGSAAGPGGAVGGAVDNKMVGPDQAPPATPPTLPSAPDAKAASVIPLDLPPETSSLRGYHPWRLRDLAPGGLPEGTVIEWWLQAADVNNLTGPGVAVSDRFLTRIGTEAQVRDALMARLANSFGTLEDSRQSQQDLARDLGKLITDKPLAPKP